jgi:hypothetical protein
MSDSASSFKYSCTPCNYHTDNAFNYTKHTRTVKHAKKMKTISNETLKCTCCNVYQTADKSNFVRHVKTCKRRQQNQTQEDNAINPDKALVSNEHLTRIVTRLTGNVVKLNTYVERLLDIQTDMMNRLIKVEQREPHS